MSEFKVGQKVLLTQEFYHINFRKHDIAVIDKVTPRRTYIGALVFSSITGKEIGKKDDDSYCHIIKAVDDKVINLFERQKEYLELIGSISDIRRSIFTNNENAMEDFDKVISNGLLKELRKIVKKWSVENA